MTDEPIYQYSCSHCGAKGPVGESWEHAKELALNEGFQARHVVKIKGFKMFCEDCYASVKQLNTTSSEYYAEKDIKKI